MNWRTTPAAILSSTSSTFWGRPAFSISTLPTTPPNPDILSTSVACAGWQRWRAEKAGWGKRKPGKGSGLGIAAQRYSFTYVASVVEVEVTEKGEVRIPRVDTAVDAGTAINPANIKAQFEGAAVFGTSIARSGEITAASGVIDQSNFFDYPVARILEAPYQTNVYIVDSDAPPAGVGEPGVSVIPPALCNAIFEATGKRIRDLPLSKNRLV